MTDSRFVYVLEWQGDHENGVSGAYSSLENAIATAKDGHTGYTWKLKERRVLDWHEWYLRGEKDGESSWHTPAYNIMEIEVDKSK